MTEDDARKRWCPLVHLRSFANWSQRTGHEPFEPGLCCIGSACMAWRWHDIEDLKLATEGFCGLAGKP